MKCLKIGLKLWSSNRHYVAETRRMFAEGHCDFLELYVDPAADTSDRDLWAGIRKDIRLHAPHSYGGFNPSKAEMFNANCRILENVDQYREALSPSGIVFHPGVEGSLAESVRQFKEFSKRFPEVFKLALIENKPLKGLHNENCIGASPKEIAELAGGGGFHFCLDFGHAICYAVSTGKNWQDVVNDFLKIRPAVFHLSDGDLLSEKDSHRHLGQGSFPLPEILSCVPDGADVVIETPHDLPGSLEDFCQDAAYLKRFLG